jgi:hypothetical protein
MTDHDPLCAINTGIPGDACDCLLIAKVRADEMEKCYADVIPRVRMAHDQLRAKVEALLNEMHSDWSNPRYQAVLALIDGGGDE